MLRVVHDWPGGDRITDREYTFIVVRSNVGCVVAIDHAPCWSLLSSGTLGHNICRTPSV